ncbi:hypothetical protein PR003_g28851 [Phytophthora rubi]|uniref:Uncharacterized protein n=1 Tax=Phytophthora rubi TaxID=129364 RepID=A0A6A3H2T7_9STRA|nr:hypothetical protein PR002_g29304 [Phytophthora rubi]KAE9277208.1 hypothetical protein PR003_g28851 [Phytophthora rubi]
MPGVWVLWQCKFSPECKGEPTTKCNGELDSMCETHRREALMSKKHRPVQALPRPLPRPDEETATQAENTTAASPSGVIADSTVDYPGHLCKHPSQCIEERTVKKNGGLHWLCERHRKLQNAEQRQRYQRQFIFQLSNASRKSTA